MLLPKQENTNTEEVRISTHELSWIQTYDPTVQVEKSVHALDCTAHKIIVQK